MIYRIGNLIFAAAILAGIFLTVKSAERYDMPKKSRHKILCDCRAGGSRMHKGLLDTNKSFVVFGRTRCNLGLERKRKPLRRPDRAFDCGWHSKPYGKPLFFCSCWTSFLPEPRLRLQSEGRRTIFSGAVLEMLSRRKLLRFSRSPFMLRTFLAGFASYSFMRPPFALGYSAFCGGFPGKPPKAGTFFFG